MLFSVCVAALFCLPTYAEPGPPRSDADVSNPAMDIKTLQTMQNLRDQLKNMNEHMGSRQSSSSASSSAAAVAEATSRSNSRPRNQRQRNGYFSSSPVQQPPSPAERASFYNPQTSYGSHLERQENFAHGSSGYSHQADSGYPAPMQSVHSSQFYNQHPSHEIQGSPEQHTQFYTSNKGSYNHEYPQYPHPTNQYPPPPHFTQYPPHDPNYPPHQINQYPHPQPGQYPPHIARSFSQTSVSSPSNSGPPPPFRPPANSPAFGRPIAPPHVNGPPPPNAVPYNGPPRNSGHGRPFNTELFDQDFAQFYRAMENEKKISSPPRPGPNRPGGASASSAAAASSSSGGNRYPPRPGPDVIVEPPPDAPTTTEPCDDTTTEPPCDDTTTEPCDDTTTEPCDDTTTEQCDDTTTEPPCDDTTTEPCDDTTTEPCDDTTTEPCDDTTTEPPCDDTTTEPPCDDTPKCPPNEEMVDCPSPCSNCQYQDGCPIKVDCESGCDCREGYARDDSGICIPKHDCPSNCDHEKEEYYKCMPDCENTCKNYENPSCAKDCNPGCFCKTGLVKREDGICVPPEKCRPACDNEDERYYDCAPNCKNTCQNCNNKGASCDKDCEPGCFCKEGLVQREADGKCILKEQCCEKENEVFYDCKPDCQNTCQNYNNSEAVCGENSDCEEGCFCKRGLVKNDEGDCVQPEKCCKNNDEQYYECMPDCKNTCENYNDDDCDCTASCSPGCFCKDGLVKRASDGKCIDPDECPKKCGENEEYSQCVSTCNTCELKGNCDKSVCDKACDCKKNFYRNVDGKCIPDDECPKKCQKEDEEFYDCVPDCKHTCLYVTTDIGCDDDKCEPGCFCKDVLVKRESDGKCVPPEQCCEPDEQYYDSKPDCQNTCLFLTAEIECSGESGPGCFCKDGLYKQDEDGKCVPPDKCCLFDDEQYYDCMPDCKNTCENYNQTDPACSELCKPGCFCKKGLLKREDDECVDAPHCDPTYCDEAGHEEYTDCVNVCNCCDACNCILEECNAGCDCIDGYKRHANGECVQVHLCPEVKCPGSKDESGGNDGTISQSYAEAKAFD